MDEVYLKLPNNFLQKKGPPKQLAQDLRLPPKETECEPECKAMPRCLHWKRIATEEGGGVSCANSMLGDIVDSHSGIALKNIWNIYIPRSKG